MLRLGHVCAFTASKGASAVHILPHAINNSQQKLSFLLSLMPVLSIMFGGDFTERLKMSLGYLSASDDCWNMLSMSAQVQRFYEAGYIGLFPQRISMIQIHNLWYPHIHVTMHRFGKTAIRCKRYVEPDLAQLAAMTAPFAKYQEHKHRYRLFSLVTGEEVRNGHEVVIFNGTLEDAQRMYDCLTVSWTVRVLLFLAGGTGTPDGDPSGDEYYYKDSDFEDGDEDSEADYAKDVKRQIRAGLKNQRKFQ